MASVSSSGDCIHCKTNNQWLESFSEKNRKIVIFGFFSKIPNIPKNTRSTVHKTTQIESAIVSPSDVVSAEDNPDIDHKHADYPII